MTIPTAHRYAAALALMQSARETRSGAVLPGQADAAPAARPKDMKAVNDFYFGSHLTATQVMFHIFERLVGHLNEKLEVGRDGSEAAVGKGNAWRETALRDRIEVGSGRDFSLPRPGENGFSFRAVASMIKSAFDLGALSQDRELVKSLEQALGFRFTGMDVGDLVEAVLDPDGAAHEKVAAVFEKGLAGQAGSKVMQRLERAAEEPKSVEETLAAIEHEPMDVVDSETIEEDREAIRNALAREKLREVEDRQDRLKELHEMRRTEEPGVAADLAMRMIQTLAAEGEAETPPEQAGAEMDEAVSETASEEPELPAAEQKNSDLLRSIIRAYREADETGERDEDRRFSMLM